MRIHRLIETVALSALLTFVGTNAWAQSQRSIEAAARVLGNQIAAFHEEPTAGNVIAGDRAASRLPEPLTDDLLNLIYDTALSHGLTEEQASATLQDMALLAGEGSDLDLVVEQIFSEPPPTTGCLSTDPDWAATEIYCRGLEVADPQQCGPSTDWLCNYQGETAWIGGDGPCGYSGAACQWAADEYQCEWFGECVWIE